MVELLTRWTRIAQCEGFMKDFFDTGKVAGIEIAAFEAGGDDAIEITAQGEAEDAALA